MEVLMSRKQHSKKFNKQQYLSIFPDVSRPVKFMSDLTRDDYIKAYSNTNLDSILSELPSNTKYTFFIKCIGQNIRLSAKHLTDIIEMPVMIFMTKISRKVLCYTMH